MSIVIPVGNIGTTFSSQNIRKLLPMPRVHPFPFYDTGGEIIYFEDWADGRLHGAQLDSSTWNAGVLLGGFTGVSTAAPFPSSGRSLHIRPPRSTSLFQDYNTGIIISSSGSQAFSTYGAGTLGPVLGFECKVGMSASTGIFGMTIERFDGVFTSDPRIKYECRCEHKPANRLWQQAWDTTGSGGGVTGSTNSAANATTIITQTLPYNIGTNGLAANEEMNWTPVKMICDTSQLTYSGSLAVSAGTALLGSLRCGDQYVQLTKPPSIYTYNQSPNTVTDKYFKFEIHVGGTTASGGYPDFYIADMIITLEPGI